MGYKLIDNVDGSEELFKDIDDLQAYCSLWSERLNNECVDYGEKPYHTVKTLEGIKEVLACCNIEFIKF